MITYSCKINTLVVAKINEIFEKTLLGEFTTSIKKTTLSWIR